MTFFGKIGRMILLILVLPVVVVMNYTAKHTCGNGAVWGIMFIILVLVIEVAWVTLIFFLLLR